MSSQPKLEAATFIPQVEDPTPLPDSVRIIYARNPLDAVICQFRFPAILKISSGPPVDFQEKLRKHYPLFREIPPIDIATGMPAELVAVIGNILPNQGSKAYEFASQDNKLVVTLSQESLALTCRNYVMWEDFRAALLSALHPLLEIYEPPFFTRIGLRYRDVIVRSRLHLEGVSWGELLSPELANEFHSRIANSIESTGHQLVIKLQGETAKVTLQHGLGSIAAEVCYIIDMDFYVNERTGADNVAGTLDYFNRQAGRLFRWCIADRLHRAMEPKAVDPARR
jgi:uncharacterized protein (TIGR04255 family)